MGLNNKEIVINIKTAQSLIVLEATRMALADTGLVGQIMEEFDIQYEAIELTREQSVPHSKSGHQPNLKHSALRPCQQHICR